jgi:hypothetical protein
MKAAIVSVKRQRGAAAIVAGLSLALLLGFVGLAIDSARMFVARTELQSAMDACALAASAQLTPGTIGPAGNPNFALLAAQAHGRAMSSTAAVSGAGARPGNSVNKVIFQSRTLLTSSVAVTFSDNLNGTFSSIGGGADSFTAKFVRCSYNIPDLPLTFMMVANLIPGVTSTRGANVAVFASAVASRSPSSLGNSTGSTSCGVVPVSICQRSSASNFGLVINEWLNGACSNGSPASCAAIAPGTFGWVDFPPFTGASAGSGAVADEIAGQGQCNALNAGAAGTAVQSQPGVANSIQKAWNSRFGIYDASSTYDQYSNPPDYTGHAYNPTGTAVAGGAYRTDYASRRASAAVFNQTGAPFVNNNFNNNTTFLSSSEYARYGRSRRLVAAPIFDCSNFAGGSSATAPVRGFACVFMLAPYPIQGPSSNGFVQKVEYLGLLSDPNTPCSLTGVPGGGGVGGGTGSAAVTPYLVQ